MRARWFLGVSMIAGVALAASLPPHHKYEMATCPVGDQASCTVPQTCAANTCNGTAPSAATEGVGLQGVSAVKLTICASTTGAQTLGGAGTMLAYEYNVARGQWARDGDLDRAVTKTSACQTWADIPIGGQFDRVRWVASGVTVSLGDGTHSLDVLVDGQSTPVGR